MEEVGRRAELKRPSTNGRDNLTGKCSLQALKASMDKTNRIMARCFLDQALDKTFTA